MIVGVVFIIGYNRLSIAKLQRSLPNANSQIVGEWKSTRGPEHLVFRADKTVSMIFRTRSGARQCGTSRSADGKCGASRRARSLERARHRRLRKLAAPLVGKYQLTEAGKVYVQSLGWKKIHNDITPQNKNRFDLIDTYTDGVTTYERVP